MELLFELFEKKMVRLKGENKVCLTTDDWDDFNFVTMFYLTVFDEVGNKIEIGNVKIGYQGQKGGTTSDAIPLEFTELDKTFFSLGQDPEYYQNIVNKFSPEFSDLLLRGLRDIVHNPDSYQVAFPEAVFEASLLRSVSINVIRDQFHRILIGQAPQTEFHFSYKMPRTHNYSGIELDFHVTPESKPPSNIHVLIGRNGVGKTTFLNNLIRSILQDETLLDDFGNVFDETSLSFSSKKIIKDDYFTSIISLSFSAFDPFTPPRDQPDRNKGTCFYYVGLKNNLSTSSEDSENGFTLKNQSELNSEFCDSLATCLSLSKKKSLWSKAIETLESDSNFQEMELWRLTEFPDNHNEVYSAASTLFSKLSSGHAIVILSITKLIEKLEEKTLVLIDEPESHLHPPLLSAFTRVLSNLLVNRNGVAIIATHSPVVLQEVPSSCVWKLFRTHLSGKAERPEIQTFGENVGTLTREVFGLEVTNSGFHNLLKESAEAGESYDSILAKYKHQLGFEGKAVLRALLANLENQEEESL